METANRRDNKHLIDLIGRRSNKTPNFSLLIGAGASASSDVKTSSQMIAEWRQRLYEQSRSDKPLEEWLKEQEWYEDEEEYAFLFEKVCDQPSQRRIYVEKCIEGAQPSWGYIYLANIIANDYFNVVFTPNFDDLLNEACCTYTQIRPIVCAHDSAVAGIRVTSARPKIIKLHGDFLYDSIKNTARELETLDKNMQDKFRQFAMEYGLVVIGYGGNDRSIMDILNVLLRSNGYFPNGIYWCMRKSDRVSKKLRSLMRRDRIYWVEIDGFDEFMAELHQGLGLTLPDTVGDPFKATTERLNRFILPMPKMAHPIIKRDIEQLGIQMNKFARIAEASKEELDRLIPYSYQGDIAYINGKYEDAIVYYKKALIQDPDNMILVHRIDSAYILTGQFEHALMLFDSMIQKQPSNWEFYYRKGTILAQLGKLTESITIHSKALEYTIEGSEDQNTVLIGRSNTYLMNGNWDNALSDAEKVLRINPDENSAYINKCIALKKLGREKEAYQLLKTALPTLSYYTRAGAYATLGNKQEMLIELEKAIDENVELKIDARTDPDFEDYREDPDFRKLVYESIEERKKDE